MFLINYSYKIESTSLIAKNITVDDVCNKDEAVNKYNKDKNVFYIQNK